MFATTVYLHRGLTHRGAHRAPGAGVAVSGLPLDHHRHATARVGRRAPSSSRRRPTRRARPAQSGAVVGFWRVQLTNAAMYRQVARDGVTVEKYARDLPPDRFDRFMFDHAFLGLGIGITFLCVTLGSVAGLLAAATHAVGYLGLSGGVNAVGHTFGRRPSENSATNGSPRAHHLRRRAAQQPPRPPDLRAVLAVRRSEIDLGWWGIRVLAWSGSCTCAPRTEARAPPLVAGDASAPGRERPDGLEDRLARAEDRGRRSS